MNTINISMILLGSTVAVGEITGNTPVSLQAAVGCAVFIGGLLWWLSRQFSLIASTLKHHSKLLSILCQKNGVVAPTSDDGEEL